MLFTINTAKTNFHLNISQRKRSWVNNKVNFEIFQEGRNTLQADLLC